MKQSNPKPLYEKTQKEVLDEWRLARAKHFRILRNSGYSLQAIGLKYTISRQAVSQLIKHADRMSVT